MPPEERYDRNHHAGPDAESRRRYMLRSSNSTFSGDPQTLHPLKMRVTDHPSADHTRIVGRAGQRGRWDTQSILNGGGRR
jgi:hypothetical protein